MTPNLTQRRQPLFHSALFGTSVNEFLKAVQDYLQDHWIKFLTAAAFMAVGWIAGKRRARSEWKRKEFLNRVNISLNVIQDGTLRIRTIIEKTCDDIFLNSAAAADVMAAARRTTPQDAVLPLPQHEYWYYLNSILNEISEKFALGQIARDFGRPVQKEVYLLCLTCECAGEMRTRKIRAMMIRKSVLENLPAEQPKLESPSHITRWETLRQLSATWKTSPYRFLEMEICL